MNKHLNKSLKDEIISLLDQADDTFVNGSGEVSFMFKGMLIAMIHLPLPHTTTVKIKQPEIENIVARNEGVFFETSNGKVVKYIPTHDLPESDFDERLKELQKRYE